MADMGCMDTSMHAWDSQQALLVNGSYSTWDAPAETAAAVRPSAARLGQHYAHCARHACTSLQMPVHAGFVQSCTRCPTALLSFWGHASHAIAAALCMQPAHPFLRRPVCTSLQPCDLVACVYARADEAQAVAQHVQHHDTG